MRLAVVVSRFNEDITGGLLRGALEAANEQGVEPSTVRVIRAPGAFELPLIAQALARSGTVDGVIALGCVIKGDTAHFEFISLGAAVGIQQAALATGVPISFGVLTTYTEEQARLRSLPDAQNKGREAALAVIETARILAQIS